MSCCNHRYCCCRCSSPGCGLLLLSPLFWLPALGIYQVLTYKHVVPATIDGRFTLVWQGLKATLGTWFLMGLVFGALGFPERKAAIVLRPLTLMTASTLSSLVFILVGNWNHLPVVVLFGAWYALPHLYDLLWKKLLTPKNFSFPAWSLPSIGSLSRLWPTLPLTRLSFPKFRNSNYSVHHFLKEETPNIFGD